MTDKPPYLGHRQRPPERFPEAGGEALPDDEMPEPVPFMARPRGDMKPLAKALLKRFGNGSVYYEASGPFSRHGYRRSVVVAFDDLDALLREIGR